MPIAALAAGEDALKPRVILFADEQLTGASRDKVAARAERFVNFQIDSLLKPLVELKTAEQLTGIGRGLAFRLVENFGVINRREVTDEVKALDQEGRAALRRLGVRFGAYHIFVPALLKPGPAGLVTLLWALKQDAKDRAGFGDVVNALAAGRTSVVVDPAFDRSFYRLAGFRMLGRRAVRVDILERLADLIRPALAWRAGTGPRPDAAYDGSAFLVTPPMMSILGANADDMEEILKGLGYRSQPKPAAEVRSKLQELDAAVVAAAEAAKPQPPEATAAAGEPHAAEFPDPAAPAGEDPAPPADGAGPAQAEAGELPDAPAVAVPDVPLMPVETALAPVVPAPAEPIEAPAEPAEAPAEPAELAAPAHPAEPAEEPKPVLVWRQGRFEARPAHRPGPQQRGRQRHGVSGEAAAGPGAAGQHRPHPKAKPGGNRNGEPSRPERRGNGKGNRPPFADKPAFAGKPREERAPRFDPDSPFAKLAALRDQLKK